MNLSNHLLLTRGSGSKVLIYRTSASTTANLTTYTFTNKSIGTAATDRRVHVIFHSFGNSRTIVTASIGGVSADITVQVNSSNSLVGLLTALVPTSTTADIIVTLSGGASRAAIGVWSSTGLTSNTATDTGTSIATPGTDSLASAVGGFCISGISNNSTSTVTWANITEQYDAQVGGASNYSGASISTTGATISPSATYSANDAGRVAVFATF